MKVMPFNQRRTVTDNLIHIVICIIVLLTAYKNMIEQDMNMETILLKVQTNWLKKCKSPSVLMLTAAFMQDFVNQDWMAYHYRSQTPK